MRTLTIQCVAKAGSAARFVAVVLAHLPYLASSPAIGSDDGMVHVDVSSELLAREARQSIEKVIPVRDVILGVPVQGNARLKAVTSLKLLDGQEKGVFELLLTGSAVSTTRANGGKAVIHCRTVTRFTARKQIVLDQRGLHAQPATCCAVATSTITGVSSPLPRLRGRLARRVAWRRAQSQRAQAERISARHSEQTIGHSFDADIALEMRQANAWLASRLKNDGISGSRSEPSFRTSITGLRVTGLPGNITDMASFQNTLKDKDVALGLRFERGNLVLTVDLPRLKAAAGGDLAESREPAVPRAARFLPD